MWPSSLNSEQVVAEKREREGMLAGVKIRLASHHLRNCWDLLNFLALFSATESDSMCSCSSRGCNAEK